MISIQISSASLILGAHTIFENLTWSIQHDQKIGLIGPNGAGKSSLFKLIVGEHSPEPGGAVARAKGVTVGYLPQDPVLPAGSTAQSCALAGNPRWAETRAGLERIEARMADPEVYNHPNRLSQAIEQQQALLDIFLAMGGESYPTRVQAVLTGLDLPLEALEKPVRQLSGGQKKLVVLASLVLAQPSVLLLDEPDNHLDLDGKAFLESLIRDYPGAVVIVSHDRYLLDAIVTHIAELEDGKLSLFEGDYTGFILEKELRLARQEELYRIQQREITRLEMARKRYLIWAQKSDKFASRMHAMEARLERIERMDRPVLERRRMSLELNGWRGSNKVLELSGVKKAYGRERVLEGIDLLVHHRERVGLIGGNGAGKSVLFRLILGIEALDGGEIEIGPSVRAGYYAQEHETLNFGETLIDTVRRGIPEDASMSESSAVSFLNRYLFSYHQTSQLVRDLSGGERSRLQLALLVLSGANFLLLDEPTNNLDIASAEVLEQALEDFDGTVLVISHDRYFLDRTVDRILVLEDGLITEYPGNYSDYEARLKLMQVKEK